jgi:hypothetical protein
MPLSIIGSIAATERHDVLAGAALVPTASHVTGTEGHDVLAGVAAFASSATMAAVERHDAATIVGSEIVGTSAVTERHDTLAGVGYCMAGALAGGEHHDTLAGSAAFKSSATMAVTERHDVGSLAGTLTSTGTIGVTGRPDVAAIAAVQTFHATGTLLAGGSDTFAGAAFHGPPGVVTGHGRNDVLAASGSVGFHATMAVTERHDVFLSGAGPVSYNIYSNTGVGDPINYGSAIATVGGLTWTSSALAYPGTWRFGVRAFNAFGEEQNLDCAVTIVLDAGGFDITLRPVAPVGLRAFAVKAS